MSSRAEGIPYGEIKERFSHGTIVPFLGAGASFGVKPELPLGRDLALELAKRSGLEGLLNGDRNLDKTTKESIKRDLARVASYYRDSIVGERGLIEYLEGVFEKNAEPGLVHRFLAEAAKARPMLIITTNYDRLIETAFEQAGVGYYLVICPVSQTEELIVREPNKAESSWENPNKLEIDTDKFPVIYKVHGSYLDEDEFRGNYLITEEHYVEMLAKPDNLIPACFQKVLRKSHFLFMGYSLSDWNFRVMMYNLNTVFYKDKVRHWAIQHKPSKVEKEIWDERKVRVFDMAIDAFIADLKSTNA